MSELRENLNAARVEYQARRYPGDLAAEMLTVRRNWWPRIVGTVVAGAAAAIVVVVLLNQSIQPNGPKIVVEPPSTQNTIALTIPGLPEMPEATAWASQALDGPIFLPSLPLFPTLADVTSETNQNQLPTTNQSPTTQESL